MILPAVLTVAGVIMIIPVATAATILAVGSVIYEWARNDDYGLLEGDLNYQEED